MTNCDSLIKQEIGKNCEDPIVQGIERCGWIINRAHVQHGSVTYKSSNEVSLLPLIASAKAFKIRQVGAKPFDGTNTTIEVGSMGGSVTSQVKILIPDNGAEVCRNIIDPMLDGEFVVILENKYKQLRSTTNPGGAAFQIYGLQSGLTLSEGKCEPWSDETSNGWSVTLTESKSLKSALYLNAGGYDKTKQLIDTLVGAAVV